MYQTSYSERWHPIRFATILAIVLAFYAFCFHFADIDLHRLWLGLPRLGAWSARAWPPDFSDFDALLVRAAETIAMATLGTTLGALIAVPLCIAGARNIATWSIVYLPTRFLLNALRGIDSFVFALLFVAAVGLGPFAGVLGVGFHTAGSIAKLWAETIEAAERGPLDATRMTGASELKVVSFALVPDVLPASVSIGLYMWEFNIRASTVLGIVGAGGLGQELKSSIDLLDFPRVFAILIVILVMVTCIDQASAIIRRRIT